MPIVIVAMLIGLAAGARGGDRNPRRTWTGRGPRTVVVWLVMGPLWLAALLLLLSGVVNTPLVTGVGVGTVVLFPWPIARTVLIPLGLVRSAWLMTSLADFTWGRDPGGGRAVAAVLAAWHGLRAPRSRLEALWQRLHRRPSDLAFARKRLQGLDLVGAGAAVAAGLLAEVDGDVVGADAIFRVVDHFDEAVVPVGARGIADDRRLAAIMADSARSRAAKVEAIMALSTASATVAFFQTLILRDDEDFVSPWQRQRHRLSCAARFLLAPRKARLWPLFRGAPLFEADETSRVEPQAASTTTTTTTTPGFGDAARRHAELSELRAPAVADIVGLAAEWEARLAEQVTALGPRAKALGVDAEQLSEGLSAQVRAALSSLVEKADLRQVEPGILPPLLHDVVIELRSRHLDALEIAVTAWRSRLEARVPKAPVDELRELASLTTLKDAVAAIGADGRYIAFEASQWVMCELAVWLWNERREPRLGNAIFRALLDDARAVGDTRSIETQTANVACGP